jgi:hypothetical protein
MNSILNKGLIIISFILISLLLGKLFSIGITKQAKIDCIKFQKQVENKNFYITQNQKMMCEEVGLPVYFN